MNRAKYNSRAISNIAARGAWALVHRVVVFGICFLILLPLLQKFSAALMSRDDIFDITVAYLPKKPSLKFITMTWRVMEYPKALLTTTLLSAAVAACQTMVCAFIGYGFARYRFPLRRVVFALLVFSLVMPPMATIISQYTQFKYFDLFGLVRVFTGSSSVSLINTWWPLILTSLTGMGIKNALYIYLFMECFRSLPKALEEAASIDGSSMLRTYFVIALPSAVPVIVTSFLFAFVWQWTDVFFSNYYIPSLGVLSTKLSALVRDVMVVLKAEMGLSDSSKAPTGYEVAVGNCGVLLTALPILLVYLFGQRFIVESITETGIK